MTSSVTHLLHVPCLLLVLLLLVLLPIPSIAQNVTLGLSLTSGVANTSWVSPSGDFAFGFRPVEDNNRFLLAIWFDKIPDKTIVWFADGDLLIPKESKVELTTTDGKLVLTDPQGKVLWTAGGEQVSGAAYAAMLDNGNFVLASGRNASDYLWESFLNPTDTILPTQFMDINRINFKLSSRVNDTTYSKGKFRLRMHENGYFALYQVAFPSLTENDYEGFYNITWSTGRNGSRLVFEESGDIYIVSGNGSIVNLTWSSIFQDSRRYYRATLDFDGIFTHYSHPKTSGGSNQSWTIERSVPENICLSIFSRFGSGVCGYSSYCSLTSNRRPTCLCPPGYELLDPNNTYGGCRPKLILQGCQEEDTSNPEDLFEFKTLENVEWPLSDYDKLDSYNEQDCRNSCMNDCNCVVAVLLKGSCWKKRLPLPNGRLDTSVGRLALIKVRKDNGSLEQDARPRKDNDRSTLVLVVSLLLGSSVFFNFIFVATIILVFFFMNKKLSKRKQKSSVLRSSLRSFSFQELVEATDGFKEEVGRGAFGIVYKGFIDETGSTIAVKKLDKVFQEGEKEFKSEVSAIGETHHRNLVRLLGFCDEGQHRLLVYEFMSNNSLAYHLFGISKPDWNQRVQIAFGISRGLLYLHEECSNQIIHCDIKPHNILLDDSFTARISDFGLAKLLMTNQTRTLTGIRGTRGYVAPEWFRNAPISAKVDVYSFGVMLLEIICCRKGVELDIGEEDNKIILTDWAYECFKQEKLHDLVDDEDCMNDSMTFERLVKIAIWCIQEEPSHRPSMKKVTQMLEGVVEVSVPPCPYKLNYSKHSDD